MADEEFAEVTPHEWAMERIRDRCSPEPDGRQNAESNLWTGIRRLKSDATKADGIERSDVKQLLGDLEADGKIIYWHGLVAPSTDEHLLAIIECERMTGAPRKILIKKCNQMRQEVKAP